MSDNRIVEESFQGSCGVSLFGGFQEPGKSFVWDSIGITHPAFISRVGLGDEVPYNLLVL